MVKLFRIFVVTSVALLLVGIFIPLETPINVSVDLNAPPPPWLVLFGSLSVVGLAGLVAAGGLLWFKSWARWLGIVVGLIGIATIWQTANSPIAASLSIWSSVVFVASVAAWAVALAMSWHPLVSSRFGHER
jgi:hypothetical protein